MKPQSTDGSSEFATAARLRSIEKEIVAPGWLPPPEATSSGAGGSPRMDVPDGILQARLGVLARELLEEGQIVVHMARDHVEEQALRLARLVVHEERQALGSPVGEPLVDGEPVALGLRDLLALLVEEELVVEPLGRQAAERLRDRAGQLHAVDQVLAGHLVIDAERHPAHGPVGLPLQLGVAAGDRGLETFAGFGIPPHDGARVELALLDRDLHHVARLRVDRQEGRVGLAPLLAQARQHDGHHGVVALENRQQGAVEPAGLVALRRRQELVVEAEGIQEGAQAGVVVGAEALVRPERVRHPGQRLVERRGQKFLVRDVVRDLPQAVHVVREGDEARRDRVAREDPEGMAHHGGARHLAEGADMGQARGAVAGLEQGLVLPRPFQPLDELARLLEGPGGGGLGGFRQRRVEGEGLCHDPEGWRRAALKHFQV